MKSTNPYFADVPQPTWEPAPAPTVVPPLVPPLVLLPFRRTWSLESPTHLAVEHWALCQLVRPDTFVPGPQYPRRDFVTCTACLVALDDFLARGFTPKRSVWTHAAFSVKNNCALYYGVSEKSLLQRRVRWWHVTPDGQWCNAHGTSECRCVEPSAARAVIKVEFAWRRGSVAALAKTHGLR